MKTDDERWQGPSLGSLVKAMQEVLQLDSQIARLKRELLLTYQDVKINAINPQDLDLERRVTESSIKRLEVRKEAVIVANKQNAHRSWTEEGDFTSLMATGVYIDAHSINQILRERADRREREDSAQCEGDLHGCG